MGAGLTAWRPPPAPIEHALSPSRCGTPIGGGRTCWNVLSRGAVGGQGYSWSVESQAAPSPSDPAVVVTNPDEPVTPEAFRAWLDRLQSGEPLHLPVRAVDTLSDLRSTGEA